MAEPHRKITVAGAGILGLWQALTLAQRGYDVRLLEANPVPFAAAASQYAGAMIAPYCEAETAPALVRDHGIEAARIWRETYPHLTRNGSLVVASARDGSELHRFARQTTGHISLDGAGLARLEGDLDGRFARALYFPDEAHMTTPDALRALVRMARDAGVQMFFGTAWEERTDPARRNPAPAVRKSVADIVIDCRGMSARDALPTLRGVRGERLVVRSRDLTLKRPIRLLHPRHPLYVVPWDEGRYLIGATVIESEDVSPITVRSALELLGLAYALHPAFGEAEIIEATAGVRPAFPDNVPRIITDPDHRLIRVNGAFRHGFLLAPLLARVTADLLDGRVDHHPLLVNT